MNWRYLSFAILAVLTMSGCSTTKQARSVEHSGFLRGIYPLMEKGGKDEAVLVDHNPKTAETPRGYYTKIPLGPILICQRYQAPPLYKKNGLPQRDLTKCWIKPIFIQLNYFRIRGLFMGK